MKQTPIISNTWETEYNEWFKEIQKKRVEVVSNNEDGEDALFIRNWGQINHDFATQYFSLLDKIRQLDLSIYNEFVNKANMIFFFWEFNDKDLRSDYIKKNIIDNKCK